MQENFKQVLEKCKQKNNSYNNELSDAQKLEVALNEQSDFNKVLIGLTINDLTPKLLLKNNLTNKTAIQLFDKALLCKKENLHIIEEELLLIIKLDNKELIEQIANQDNNDKIPDVYNTIDYDIDRFRIESQIKR